MAQFFNLTLDTTAPSSGSASGLQAYYNTAPSVTISASGASFMYVWVDQNATGTAPQSITWEPYATSKTLTPSTQGTNYFHAIFMDEVGNVSGVVDSSSFVYDTVVPTVSAVSIENGAGYTRTTSVSVRVSFSDATSGVNTITLGGDIASAEKVATTLTATDRTNGYKDFTVTLQGADGTKSVTAVATDFAGNASTAGSDDIVLDTTAAEFTPVLRNAGDTANLASYVNDDDYALRIMTEATDITHFKIWEDGDTEPSWVAIDDSSVSEIEGGYLVSGLALSSGDGLKTIKTKVQDIAGNVTAGTDLTVTYDTTAPSVTFSASPTVISAQTGHNSSAFTLTATDTNASAGMTYVIKLGNTTIKSGTYDGNDITITEAEMVAISSGEGVKSFTAEVTDAAGNTGTSTAQTVTVDLTAPTGSVSADSIIGSQSFNVTVAGSDTGGATLDYMKVWLDSNEPQNWESFSAGSYAFSNIAEGEHTVYLKLKDSVDNASSTITGTTFVVDVTAPTGTITGPTYTNTASITLTISASDAKGSIAVSGLDKMKVWETGTTEPSSWEDYAASKSLTLTAVDGAYTVSMKLKDAAGNTSTTIVSNTINLDQDEPQGTINLFKSDDSTPLPAHVNVRGFYAHIAPTDATAPSPVQYRIYGDFDEAMASDAWLDYAADSGKQYKSIEGTLTNSDGTKTIYVQFKDAAGNTSTAASASTIYDSAPPVIDVDSPDYNIVSLEHTLRRDPSTAAEITGKYNDMCTFTWSANEDLQAFKVCVNTTGQTAEGATAIGTTYGSQNMSGSSVSADTDVTSIIMGADFDAVEAVTQDGVYEVIVYGKDLAGTWSQIHVMS